MSICSNCWMQSIRTASHAENPPRLTQLQWKKIRNKPAKNATANREWGRAVRLRWCASSGPVESKPTIANVTACTCWIMRWIDYALSCPPSPKKRNWPKSKHYGLPTITSGPYRRRWILSGGTIHRPEASRWMSAMLQSASAIKEVPSLPQILPTIRSFHGTIDGLSNLLSHNLILLLLLPRPLAEQTKLQTIISMFLSTNWPTRKRTTSSNSSSRKFIKHNLNRRGCLARQLLTKQPTGHPAISTTNITFPILLLAALLIVTTLIHRPARDITTCCPPNSRVFKKHPTTATEQKFGLFLISNFPIQNIVCKNPHRAAKNDQIDFKYAILIPRLDLL